MPERRTFALVIVQQLVAQLPKRSFPMDKQSALLEHRETATRAQDSRSMANRWPKEHQNLLGESLQVGLPLACISFLLDTALRAILLRRE